MEALVGEANKLDLALLLSLPHDFPSEWHQFVTGNADFKATVKRDYFPYFTKGKEIAINAMKIHAIKAEAVQSTTPPGLSVANLTQKLKDDEEFELSLAPDGAVLVREQQAQVFVVIKYSLALV